MNHSPSFADSGDRVLVWDLPTRVFHWLLAAAFLMAWITGEAHGWMVAHVVLGYTMLGLIAFRLLWGLIGTRYARFRSFAFGPRAVAAYLGSLLTARPTHYLGHNPAGSWAIYGLLGASLLAGASGWLALQWPDGGWLEEVHEAFSSVLLALVLVHVAGVVLASLRHRENLVRAMVDGRKRGTPSKAAQGALAPVAIVLVIAVIAFWVTAMRGDLPALTQAAATRAQQSEEDD